MCLIFLESGSSSCPRHRFALPLRRSALDHLEVVEGGREVIHQTVLLDPLLPLCEQQHQHECVGPTGGQPRGQLTCSEGDCGCGKEPSSFRCLLVSFANWFV